LYRSSHKSLQPYAFPCLQHTFGTLEQLRRHLLEEHAANLNSLANPSFIGSSRGGFICYLHGGSTRSELVDHCELEHKIPGDEREYLAVPSDSLQKRAAREEHYFVDNIGEDYLSDDSEGDSEDEEKYFCEVCPAEYEQRAPFARHLVSHLENIHRHPYRCRRCDLSFSSEEDYNDHRISQPHIVVHSSYWAPEIFCPFKCGEVFTDVLERNEHARAMDGFACKNRLEQESLVWNTALSQLSQLSAQLNLQLAFQRSAGPGIPKDLAIKMILANISRWVD
jgi:hypothetical protein